MTTDKSFAEMFGKQTERERRAESRRMKHAKRAGIEMAAEVEDDEGPQLYAMGDTARIKGDVKKFRNSIHRREG